MLKTEIADCFRPEQKLNHTISLDVPLPVLVSLALVFCILTVTLWIFAYAQ